MILDIKINKSNNLLWEALWIQNKKFKYLLNSTKEYLYLEVVCQGSSILILLKFVRIIHLLPSASKERKKFHGQIKKEKIISMSGKHTMNHSKSQISKKEFILDSTNFPSHFCFLLYFLQVFILMAGTTLNTTFRLS